MTPNGSHGLAEDGLPEIDLTSEAFQLDPWPVYHRLRAIHPVHWSPQRVSYVVLSHQHVVEAFRSEAYTNAHAFRASRMAFGGATILDTEGPEHLEMRARLSREFARTRVTGWISEVVEPVVDAVFDGLPAEGELELVEDVAREVPMRVMTRILGLPESDSAWLTQHLKPLVEFIDNPRSSLEDAVSARKTIIGYLEGMEADGNLELIDRVFPDSPDGEMRDVMLRTVVLLLAAGTETTVGAISNVFTTLLANPDALDQAQGDPSLTGAIIRETLRWEAPLHTTLRFARTDTELGGVAIPRGARVELFLGAASRDATHNEDPDVWNPDRPATASVVFGVSRHACLGRLLANAELEVVLRKSLDRLAAFEPVGALPPIVGGTFRRPRELHVRRRDS